MRRTDTKPTTRLSRRLVRIMGMAGLLAILSLFSLAPAQASTDRVAQGDAEAVLRAFGNGGWAIRNHHGVITTDPAEGLSTPADIEGRASIRPLPMFDGRHYCAEDWHVIALALIEGGDRSFGIQDARAILDTVTLDLVLDGEALPTERSSIKRFLAPERFGFEEAYYFQQGAILPPSALTVGSHTLAETDTSIHGTFTFQITFFIDASGAGVCV